MELQYKGQVMKLSFEISSWAAAKEYELGYDRESPCREWSGRGELACELFALKYCEADIVPLALSILAKSKRFFVGN